jgi:nicotinamidase-related amidase
MASRDLRISPRYYRWHVDLGVDWVETNTEYAQLDWKVPLEQSALVLVDVWEGHYLADCEARINAITENHLAPLLSCARSSGMPVIHAPSPDTAKRQSGWVRLADKNPRRESDPEWPPKDFTRKEGDFATFARPFEPRESELDVLRTDRPIHKLARPEAGEAVVANGEELHLYCKREGILFLFFVGFNTNCCVLLRDYGTIAMRDRGYEVVIVRDCTTGMESYDSQAQLGQTNGAILFLEMFRAYSTTSDEMIAALSRGGNQGD